MRAALYCRLSEEDRDKQYCGEDSASIRNQKSMLLQYAREQNWEVYDIYSDDDYAGADRNRPEFRRLLEDARLHRFDIVLCKTQSRFTRELELVEKYIHGLFPLWGIRFVSIVDNADTADRKNKKTRQINGLINEWYLEDMSENIRSVLKNRRENGFHVGAFALYGYRKDPEQKGHLLIDRDAAAVVRKVFVLFSQGWGKAAIARQLNSEGIPNPTEYKRLQGLRYRQPNASRSTLWSYSAISRMLANEIYIGNMVQGKYGSISYKTKQNRLRPKSEWCIVPGTHEPIIDRELWDQVQELLLLRSKPFGEGTVGLFAGKARCAGCGAVLRSTSSRGRRYLKCPVRSLSAQACPGAFISLEQLELTVRTELARITDLYFDPEMAARSLASPRDLSAEKKTLLSRISACRKREEEYDAGLDRLYLDRTGSAITEAAFSEMRDRFLKEKDRLKREASAASSRLQELERSASLSSSCSEDRTARFVRPERLTREIVTAMVDFISVGRRLPGSRTVPVEIHWTF